MKRLSRDREQGSAEFTFAVVLITLVGGCLMLLMPLIARVVELQP